MKRLPNSAFAILWGGKGGEQENMAGSSFRHYDTKHTWKRCSCPSSHSHDSVKNRVPPMVVTLQIQPFISSFTGP